MFIEKNTRPEPDNNSPCSSCNVCSEGEGRSGGGVKVPVGKPGPGVEPEVDQQRPRVLAEEHSRPSDLKASVLKFSISISDSLGVSYIP